MNNTAKSAGLQTIKFVSRKYRDFYEEYLLQCRHQDIHHKVLIYCIGISEDTRNHFNNIYELKSVCVNPEYCYKKAGFLC